jgi:hypothetical protein
MRYSRRKTAALLAGMVVLGLSACGGSSKKATTTTTTSAAGATSTTATTTTRTTTTTTTTKSGKPKPTPLSQTPATTQTFSGSGPKELGVVRIPKNSTINWTNDAPAAVRIFQVIPASVKVQSPVNSRDASGSAQIHKGAYHGFLVNADGKWTMTIVPNG